MNADHETTRAYRRNDEDLITTEELAKILSVPAGRLRKARVSGDDSPPFVKLGKRLVRYRLGDVRKWLATKPVIYSTSKIP